MVKKLAGILLAAGNSTRLGQPKQLLRWHGKTLLERAVDQLTTAVPDEVFLVYGDVPLPLGDINSSMHLLHNQRPEQGMGRSLKLALKKAQELDCSHVLITLVDQPLIPRSHWHEIRSSLQQGFRCVATGITGEQKAPPMGCQLDLLLSMLTSENNSDIGARTVVKEHCDKVIFCPEAGFDIDSPEDWKRLKTMPLPPETG